jgi:hypothetical protein
MTLDLVLIDGLTATLIITTSISFGALSLYNAKKLGAKLLYWAAALVVVVGFLWLGPFIEFLTVVFTAGEVHLPGQVYGWLSYLWVGPGVLMAMYLGGELLAPDKKNIIIIIFGSLGILFEVLMFAFPDGRAEELFFGTFTWEPVAAGELLMVNTGFNNLAITFWLVALFLGSILIFEGIGFALKAKQATGALRKKFVYLSIGFTIFVVCGALDSILDVGPIVGIVRGVMSTFAIWTYLGLKA